jgi:CBS domain-containing protein
VRATKWTFADNSGAISMTTIREVLKNMPPQPMPCVSPDDTVYQAISIMSKEHLGALLVTENEDLVGIVTEGDYARKVILQNRTSRTTPVLEIMTREVLYITPEDRAEACMALMIKKRVRYLPVIDNGMIVGMVSMRDLARAIITDHEVLIDELTNYIVGERGARAHPERIAAGTRRIDQ